MTIRSARGNLSRYYTWQTKRESIWNVFPVSDVCQTDEPEGMVPCLQCWRHLTGMWIAYSDSSHFSDRFTYINYFNPNYGLEDMNFKSFNQFLEFLKLSNSTLSETVIADVSMTSAVNFDWSKST